MHMRSEAALPFKKRHREFLSKMSHGTIYSEAINESSSGFVGRPVAVVGRREGAGRGRIRCQHERNPRWEWGLAVGAHSVIWQWGCLWGLTVGSSGGGAGSGGSQWELTLKRTNPIMPTTTTSPAEVFH